MPSPPLYGLVLAGGASRRMNTDKAALRYAGKPQLHRAYELLSAVCARAYVSVRADQQQDAMRKDLPQIVDLHTGLGPLAGIASAQAHSPQVAWLVMACDLPFVELATLEYLVAHRDPTRLATAFRSTYDELPEPLCAIWEPASVCAVSHWIEHGKNCPRKLLIDSDIALLTQSDSKTLDNVNTPDDHLHALQALAISARDTTPIALNIQYFAVFREQAGKRAESLQTSAYSPAALYAELQQRYHFKLTANQVKVAVNNEFCDWHTPLKHHDTVAFIPPVAGG